MRRMGISWAVVRGCIVGGTSVPGGDEALRDLGAKNRVNRRREMRGGGEVPGLEFLRVGEVIAELFDIPGETIGLAPRSEPEQ